MGRSQEEVVAVLPVERRERVEARYQELREHVEGHRELREAAGKAQADIAAALDIKQPSVSYLEKQADVHVLTLRSYVRAVGGDLKLVVRLPARAPIHLQNLGDIGSTVPGTTRSRRPRNRPPGKRAAKAG